MIKGAQWRERFNGKSRVMRGEKQDWNVGLIYLSICLPSLSKKRRSPPKTTKNFTGILKYYSRSFLGATNSTDKPYVIPRFWNRSAVLLGDTKRRLRNSPPSSSSWEKYKYSLPSLRNGTAGDISFVSCTPPSSSPPCNTVSCGDKGLYLGTVRIVYLRNSLGLEERVNVSLTHLTGYFCRSCCYYDFIFLTSDSVIFR